MGKFFVFEGIDGSGKTTLSKLVANKLEAPPNIEIIWHREPTDGAYGKQIRNFLTGRITLTKTEQMELFLKDRHQSVTEVIRPNITKGNIVIQDRYIYSTAAYQGGNEFTCEEILLKNEEQGFPKPNLVFFIDLTPEEARERRVARGGKKEYFDEDSSQNLIYQNYMKILPANTVFLDGNANLEELTTIVLEQIMSYIVD
ncbi:MAG: dTMP kinase [Leptospira sp.]|nr:dTMP kinase [Leptospira sp.]